ncbi:hypothetical protein B0H14DRAFT_2641174 [Mycena olivaceomarginata]|nr:hypothetical protein B0H14DRAFT_2641174 [Mycena olivaceomarginata]
MTILRSPTPRARRQELRALHIDTSAIRTRRTSGDHLPPLSSSATGIATTNTTWANHEINEPSSHLLDAQSNLISVSFLSGVHLGDNVRKISVGLKRKVRNAQTFSDSSSQLHFKTTAQVQDCHSVLTAAEVLYGMLDSHHIESCSKVLHDSYKVGTRSQRRNHAKLLSSVPRGLPASALFDKTSTEDYCCCAFADLLRGRAFFAEDDSVPENHNFSDI